MEILMNNLETRLSLVRARAVLGSGSSKASRAAQKTPGQPGLPSAAPSCPLRSST